MRVTSDSLSRKQVFAGGIGELLFHLTQYWVHTTACVKVDRDLRFFEICVYYNGMYHLS
jgi:hypothetical protein